MSSLLFRSLKCSQLARNRIFLAKSSIYNIVAGNNLPTTTVNICAIRQSQQRFSSNMPPPPKQPDNDKKVGDDHEKKREPEEYEIKFKAVDIKYQIKQFYSLYGPLFLVCHIGIALTSLGFFCSLVWFNINLGNYIPDMFSELVGQTAANLTGTGGKFVIAYALHKLLLPFRLVMAISLTKFLSPKVKLLKNKIFGN